MDGKDELRSNAHDVAERFTAILRVLDARARQRGHSLDLADVEWRRRVYRAARRLENARTRRGDLRPFLADEYLRQR